MQGGVQKDDRKRFLTKVGKIENTKGSFSSRYEPFDGQNPGYINNIETGKSMPSLTGFFYICDYLDIAASDFLMMEMNVLNNLALFYKI